MARWARIAWQIRRLDKALDKEARIVGYDYKVTAKKAARALLGGLISVLLAATVGFLTDQPALIARAIDAATLQY